MSDLSTLPRHDPEVSVPSTTAAAAKPAGSYRWIVCALLFFATTINYVDRQILALIKPVLDRQLGWSEIEYSHVFVAFQASYAVGLLGFGWFVDRFGTKLGYAVSIAAWSLAAMSHGLVGSVRGFFGARVALGLGEGGNFPSAIKAISLWFPKKERALATSIQNSGANVGALLAPLAVPFVTLHYGWQASFVVAGVVGLLWLGLWLPLYEIPERQRRATAGELAYIRSDPDEGHTPEQHRPVRYRELLVHPQAWSFIVSKFLTDPVWWFYLGWLPTYFNKSRHLDLQSTGAPLVTIYGMVTVLSILGGWLPGRLIRRGWSVTRARKSCLLLYAAAVVPVYFATSVGNWAAVGLIGLAASAHQAWSANLYTTVSDLFPKRMVATLIGLGGMAGSAGAMGFPELTGRMLNHFEAAGNITEGYRILFTMCAFAYLVAFVVSHWLAPSFEPVPVAENAGVEVAE